MFGFPKDRIRDLLQRWGRGLGGPELVQEVLNVSEPDAAKLLADLIRNRYVERCAPHRALPGWQYELTAKGTKLAWASTGKALRREAAQRLLEELLGRMKEVNADRRFLLGVQEASVFGDYVTSAERLRHLDVRYTTYRKLEERRAFARAVERAAAESGRRFSGEVERRLWPEDDVRDYLVGNSRVYRLSVDAAPLHDDMTPRLVVFEDRAPVPGWRELCAPAPGLTSAEAAARRRRG
jgi:hypothetical protein